MFSYPKRDRQSLFQRIQSLQIPQAPPPTFLFLLIFNCQITDQTSSQKPSTKPAPNLSQEQQTSIPPIRLSFFRTKDFVASSAAALVQ